MFLFNIMGKKSLKMENNNGCGGLNTSTSFKSNFKRNWSKVLKHLTEGAHTN